MKALHDYKVEKTEQNKEDSEKNMVDSFLSDNIHRAASTIFGG